MKKEIYERGKEKKEKKPMFREKKKDSAAQLSISFQKWGRHGLSKIRALPRLLEFIAIQKIDRTFNLTKSNATNI